MKRLYLFFILCFIATVSFAQLPDGSTAPNFTLTDLNGESHTLYDVLDQGIPAIIDFSATWCGPCWSYHQTGILDELYDEYGPTGTVEPNSLMVYWIESDDATNDACMTNSAGCTGGTQGDWTDGTHFPLFNPPHEQVPQEYAIGAYPTVIAVCPDRKMYEMPLQPSKQVLEEWMFQSCPLDQSFASTDEACYNDGSGMIDLTVTDGFGTINYSWNTGATTEDLIGVGQGTYSCVITDGKGRSIETPDIVVEGQSSALALASETITPILCNGEANGSISISATGGGGGYSYQWSNGATGPTIGDLPSDSYSVVITDADGCISEETFDVPEPLPLTESMNVLPASCDQDNGTIILQGNGGTAPYFYDIGVDNNTSGLFLNVPAGEYVGFITDINGCQTGTFPLVIESIPGPEAQASSSDQLSCANNMIQLDGTGSSEGSNINYTWSTPDGNIVEGGNTLNPTVDAPGTYIIEVMNLELLCSEIATVVVTGDFLAPMSDAGPNQSLDCNTTEVNLDGTNSTSGGNISYVWETSNGNIVAGENMPVATVNGAGEYQLIVTNEDNGCSSTSTVTVTQSAEVPVSDAGSMQALTCNTFEVLLDGSNSSAGDGYTYVWSTDDGSILEGGDTPLATVDQPGVYVLEVINDANGCIAVSSVEVIVDTNEPDGAIDVPTELTCELTEQTLSYVIEGDNYSVVWTTSDGNIVSGENTLEPVINAPGTYEVEVTNTENGCVSTSSVVVTETINTPVADYSFTSDKKDFTFEDNSAGSPSDYLWNFGDGETSTEQNPSHTYAVKGEYEVCLTITNECGENTTCNTIIVTGGASLANQQDLTDLTCNAECNGTATIITEEDLENYTISITGPDGFSSTDFELIDLCAGTYTYTLTNDDNESVDGSFEISEPEPIQVSTSEVIDVDCNGDETGLINVTFSGGTGDITLTWNTGDEGNEISELSAGEYSVVATDANGCEQTLDFTILEPSAIEITDSAVEDITDSNPTGSIDITVAGGTPGYTFLWSNGDETEDIAGLEEGEYSVDVTDENGCVMNFGPFEVKSVIRVTEIESLEKITLQPNPVREQVIISLDFIEISDVNISLINNLGQVVKQVNQSGDHIVQRMNVDQYSSGLYFVKVSVNDQTTVRKLIIE